MMLPLTFDRHVLASPLLDYEDSAGRLMKVLRAIVEQRVLPLFAEDETVDRIQLARASERYSLVRLEEPKQGLELVSLLAKRDDRWTVFIHERVFDYFAFGLPLDPARAFETPTREARKVLALAEFILRHQFERMVRPERNAEDVLASDCEFVASVRTSEPAFHTALMEALEDGLNGLRTDGLLELFRRFDEDQDWRSHAAGMISEHLPTLCELPTAKLAGVFLALGFDEKERLLDACHARCNDESLTVAERARQLANLEQLFAHQRREDLEILRQLFERCLERWPSAAFLREFGVDVAAEESEDGELIFERFVQRLAGVASSESTEVTEAPRPPVAEPSLDSPYLSNERPKTDGSLKDRIELARLDPAVPRSVLRTIDNNFDNIEGHSKAKYTEFIETLLAVPWGVIRPIEVGPREFAAGLDSSHFGLESAKELVSDFFANLIWRYRDFAEEKAIDWHRTGSAFLFVGPPGVGKTSLAISIAKNLGIPFHKISLGGMRDEAALRGHGFTYEGSKPGAVVQGLSAMESMNGMFILDEADKTEPFAIATLLEILDPEQNHLFHDKYIQTTVDIDLSNCHFILTANTLETVPAPVIDRCQVVYLGRYSVEEKVEIARRHILPRLRRLHDIPAELIDFEPDQEPQLLRFLIQNYTHEAGVRQLELVLRTLLLRLQRREVFEGGSERVTITRPLVKRSLDEPGRPATINSDDRVGEVLALGVNAERGIGAVIPVQATRVPATRSDDSSAISMVHATGNLEKVMDESRRVATTAILHCAESLGLDPAAIDAPVHLHFLGGSTPKDGPSAGAAIALSITSLLTGDTMRRDVAVTGELDTQGRVTGVGGIDVKLETAVNAGCKTLIIPRDNLTGPGGIERLPEPVRKELLVLEFERWAEGDQPFDPDTHLIQVVAVDNLEQAYEVAVVDMHSIAQLSEACIDHARTHGANQRERQLCPMLLVVKDRDDLDDEHFNDAFCANCVGCRLLVPRDAKNQPSQVPAGSKHSTVTPIESGPDGLRTAVETAVEESPDGVRVIAPFYALRENDVSNRPGVRVFASNFDAHGRKLKGLKPLIHRLVCRLAHLGEEALASMPLMSQREGVWVADLSRLMEKIRLDPGRSREIFVACAEAWLAEIDGKDATHH